MGVASVTIPDHHSIIEVGLQFTRRKGLTDKETERALSDLEDAAVAAQDALEFVARDLREAGYADALIAKLFRHVADQAAAGTLI